MRAIFLVLTATFALPAVTRAQQHEPPPGQAAFAAIADVVRQLDADPSTDWSTVDVEALRQHLIDMDEVTMRAETEASPVPGGARFAVRGSSPRTIAAIRRMLRAHGPMLAQESGYRVRVVDSDGGVEMTVLAPDGAPPAAVARIRALGVAGLLTLGGHHAPHHLAIARGGAAHAHH